MRPSPRFDLRPSSLWLALLVTPLFVGQALAAPEVHLYVDGKPVAEALTLDKGTISLTHKLDKGSHQIRIADSARTHDPDAPHHIRALTVLDNCRLGASRVLAQIEPGIPDGLRVDVQGNIWTSAGDGIQCFAPCGTLLGKILLPEKVANLTFGGPRRNRLFITANTSLYMIHVAVAGAQMP